MGSPDQAHRPQQWSHTPCIRTSCWCNFICQKSVCDIQICMYTKLGAMKFHSCAVIENTCMACIHQDQAFHQAVRLQDESCRARQGQAHNVQICTTGCVSWPLCQHVNSAAQVQCHILRLQHAFRPVVSACLTPMGGQCKTQPACTQKWPA